jgi:hypothetical protein
MSDVERRRAIELIRKGARLHYDADADDDSLLRGDQLYAEGLALLATLGDLDTIAALAEVISTVAQAHAEGDLDRAQAAWEGVQPS